MRNIKSINVARNKRSIKESLNTVQIKIDNLLLMQSKAMPPEALDHVMKTFEQLSKEKEKLEKDLAHLSETNEKDEVVRESVHAIQGRLREFERGFKKAKGAMKKRLLKKLLKQVVVDSTGLHIFMSIAHEMEIPNHQLKLVNIRGSKDGKISTLALARRASGDDSNLSFFSSDIRKDGGLTPT